MENVLSSLGINDPASFMHYLQVSLRIVLIVVGAWFILRLADKGIRILTNRMKARAVENYEEVKRIETLSSVLHYIAVVALYVVAGMVILGELGISIAPILTTAGVVGIAVGFAAQSLIKDYFTGFFLLIENQVREGDIIEVADKAGYVEDVTLRYIRLRDYGGHVHFIPNGTVTTVTSMTRRFAYSVIDAGVAYREDIDEVIDLMVKTAAGMQEDEEFGPSILEPMEVAGVNEWGDSAVVIRTRFKVKPMEQWAVKREYLRRLKYVFDENDIEIPFPHVTVYPGLPKEGVPPALHVHSSNDA